MGSDIYDGEKTVILANGNWINARGFYDATNEQFVPNDPSDQVDQAYVSRINTSVQNTIKISYLIMDEDYFEKRVSICRPK